ncbi:MAG: hypothetical protein AB7T49_04245 [Oligoflexales bacterium]
MYLSFSRRSLAFYLWLVPVLLPSCKAREGSAVASATTVTEELTPLCGRIYLVEKSVIINPQLGNITKIQRLIMERTQSGNNGMGLVHDLVYYPKDNSVTNRLVEFLRQKKKDGALEPEGEKKAFAIVQTMESPKFLEIGIGGAVWPTSGIGVQFADFEEVESCP